MKPEFISLFLPQGCYKYRHIQKASGDLGPTNFFDAKARQQKENKIDRNSENFGFESR